jgi:hypothetical protein
MAVEGLKRIFDVPAIKREGKNPPQKKKVLKKQDKEEKTEGSKVDIKV